MGDETNSSQAQPAIDEPQPGANQQEAELEQRAMQSDGSEVEDLLGALHEYVEGVPDAAPTQRLKPLPDGSPRNPASQWQWDEIKFKVDPTAANIPPEVIAKEESEPIPNFRWKWQRNLWLAIRKEGEFMRFFSENINETDWALAALVQAVIILKGGIREAHKLCQETTDGVKKCKYIEVLAKMQKQLVDTVFRIEKYRSHLGAKRSVKKKNRTAPPPGARSNTKNGA